MPRRTLSIKLADALVKGVRLVLRYQANGFD
jgi:hypothetical protein